MWSVKTVPKVSSESLGFGLCVAAFTTLMASVMVPLLPELSRSLLELSRSLLELSRSLLELSRSLLELSRSSLKDDRFPVEAEDLPVDVGDLAERDVVLDGIHQHGHHVVTAATRVGQLLESPLHLGHVARSLEPPHALDLLSLHR